MEIYDLRDSQRENMQCPPRFNQEFLPSEFPLAACFHVDLSFLIKQLILGKNLNHRFELKTSFRIRLSLSLFFVTSYKKICFQT